MPNNYIKSMTAYTAFQANAPEGQLSLSIRAVNSRYLDISFTFSEGINHLEPVLAKIIKSRISRGKVECILSFKANAQGALRINETLLKAISSKLETVSHVVPHGSTNLMELLNFPGMLQSNSLDQKAVDRFIVDSFTKAANLFEENRLAEGANLSQVITSKLDEISGYLDDIQCYLSQLTQNERERLMTRIENLQINLDPTRLEQEVALLAQKSDIAEEYDRLRSHIKTVHSIIESNDKVHGKRLDFMMQEMTREANTIASKAGTLDITKVSVELKVLIEQIREQVQNIE